MADSTLTGHTDKTFDDDKLNMTTRTDADRSSGEKVADEIHLVYVPGDVSVGEALSTSSYRRYLQRTRHGPVATGDVWNEFVARGCGATRDIVLRVVSVERGTRLGDATTLVFDSPDERD